MNFPLLLLFLSQRNVFNNFLVSILLWGWFIYAIPRLKGCLSCQYTGGYIDKFVYIFILLISVANAFRVLCIRGVSTIVGNSADILPAWLWVVLLLGLAVVSYPSMVLFGKVVSHHMAIGGFFRRFFRDRTFYRICLCIAVSAVVLMLVCVPSKDMWLDEVYTLEIIKKGYWSSIELTAADVHPPLYYLIVRAIMDLGYVLFSAPFVNSGRLASIIPSIILIFFSIFAIRPRWGSTVAGASCLLLLTMPHMMEYGIEIRMYSWALLFVTLTYYFAFKVVEKKRAWDWGFLIFFGMCSAYTHYFAALAVGYIYTVIGLWLFFRDRRALWKWGVSILASVIIYMPWLFIFISQLLTVRESYWIYPINWEILLNYLIYPFSFFSFFALVLLVLRKRLSAVVRRPISWEKVHAACGIAMPVFIVSIAVVISILMRPIFIERYMVPSLGCFWMGFAILMAKKVKKNGFMWLLLWIMSMVSMYVFVSREVEQSSH